MNKKISHKKESVYNFTLPQSYYMATHYNRALLNVYLIFIVTL